MRIAPILCAIMTCSAVFAQAPNPRHSHGIPVTPDHFPIAVWLQEPTDAAAYKALGINLYVGLWAGPTEQQLSTLRAVQMPVMCEQNATGLAWRDSATIVGWTQMDEPDNAQWNATTNSFDPCVNPDSIIAVYQRWRAADSSRPVYLNLGQGVAWTSYYGRGTCTGNTSMYPRYLQGCDISSFDIYPVTSTDNAIKGDIRYVGRGIDNLRLWSGDSLPAWCWIECTQIDSDVKPTPAQVRAEVWIALIHGARGFGYFCHEWKPVFRHNALLLDTAMRSAVSAINSEVRSLAPALNGPVSGHSRDITAVSSNTAVQVQWALREPASALGMAYLFAVSVGRDTSTVTFRLGRWTLVGSTVEVHGEGRTLPLVCVGEQCEFSDTFAPLATHTYVIRYPDSARPSAMRAQVRERGTVRTYLVNGASAGAGPGAPGVRVVAKGLTGTALRIVDK